MKHGYAVLNEKELVYFTNEKQTKMIVLSSEKECHKLNWHTIHISKEDIVRDATKEDFDNFKIYRS